MGHFLEFWCVRGFEFLVRQVAPWTAKGFEFLGVLMRQVAPWTAKGFEFLGGKPLLGGVKGSSFWDPSCSLENRRVRVFGTLMCLESAEGFDFLVRSWHFRVCQRVRIFGHAR